MGRMHERLLRIVFWRPGRPACAHLGEIREVTPRSDGCDACRAAGSSWSQLRICLTCGYVGCCDSSKHKHARQHFEETGHPIARSFEPDESWRWCYADRRMV